MNLAPALRLLLIHMILFCCCYYFKSALLQSLLNTHRSVACVHVQVFSVCLQGRGVFNQLQASSRTWRFCLCPQLHVGPSMPNMPKCFITSICAGWYVCAAAVTLSSLSFTGWILPVSLCGLCLNNRERQTEALLLLTNPFRLPCQDIPK